MTTRTVTPRRIANELKATWRRHVRSPFPSGQDVPVIVHCGYHKAGTVWFQQVLRSVAHEYGLRFQIGRDHQDRPSPGTQVFVQQHSRLDIEAIGTFRGSHIIRDPRDMIVSAYLYHLWTDEAWVHRPREEFEGRSYQQELNRRDQTDGLTLEIERSVRLFRRMGEWDYSDPRFLELRFEDVRRDERTEFERLFRHYGFTEQAVAKGLDCVDYFSWEKAKQREAQRGEDGPSHLRSKKAGEWQTVLEPTHLARIDELYGDVLRKLGYA